MPILADVMVKHATPPPGLTLESAARDTWYRGLADGLILTGTETGEPVDRGRSAEVREALPAEAKDLGGKRRHTRKRPEPPGDCRWDHRGKPSAEGRRCGATDGSGRQGLHGGTERA